MAKVIESKKEFLLIEATRLDISQIGGFGICDFCNNTSDNGVLIPVLNQWYCMGCFNDWHNRAKRYSEDIPIEERNFNHYKAIFEL